MEDHNEASQFIEAMPLILEHKFGARIWSWFTDDVTAKFQGYQWTPEEGLVSSLDQQYDKAVEELGNEILRISPEGGPISQTTLAVATSLCNSRVRRDGLSSLELWTQRDQITGDQLPISDTEVIKNQNDSRNKNHISSAKSKFK